MTDGTQLEQDHDRDRGDPLASERLSRSEARRYEEQFIDAFVAGFGRLEAIPSPIEGTVYDVAPAKEFRRDWNELAEARRQLLRVGQTSAIDQMPLCPVVQYSIVRKPLFGGPSPRVSIVAACYSPQGPLAQGPIDPESHLAGIEVVDNLLEQLLVQERTKLFHFIAICSTTGWDPMVTDPLPEGKNYRVALIEPRPPGWMTYIGDKWPGPLREAIQPENAEARKARVQGWLARCDELALPGGLLLIDELAEMNAVEPALALEVAKDFAKANPTIVVEKVEGSMIIRRKRGGKGSEDL